MGIYGRLDAAARRDLLKEVSLDKQYYKEHIQNILYDNYVKLALVNIDTGEYVSVISVDKNADNYKSTSDVSSYFKDNKGLDCCHPDEVIEFAYMCDMMHVIALIEAGA